MAVAMSKTRRATNHFPLRLRLEKAGRMATETPSPEYKILEDSAGVQHVSHKDGTFYIEVRTSGWAEIDGKVYSWDTVAQDIPLHRVSEESVRSASQATAGAMAWGARSPGRRCMPVRRHVSP